MNPTPIVTSTYTPNLLNQYSQRTVPAYEEISGTANADAVLSFLNEDTATRIRAGRNQEWFHAFMPLSDNSSSAVTNAVRMTGVLPGQGTGGNDLINTNQAFSLSVDKTPQVFSYDDDGNMTSDGRFTYSWNCENRLVAVSNETTLVASYKYDHQGRRVSKTVSGVTTVFVWAGNHIVYEKVGANPNVYTWGNDGYLVAASLNGTNVFYCHDGNKNATDLVSSSGSIVAHYEFDPFGNQVIGTGSLADANPFRFSNEYLDKETGHLAYLRRKLNTVTGNWLSRDPIGELSSYNLYCFINNWPINGTDLYGLYVIQGTKSYVFDGVAAVNLSVLDSVSVPIKIPYTISVGYARNKDTCKIDFNEPTLVSPEKGNLVNPFDGQDEWQFTKTGLNAASILQGLYYLTAGSKAKALKEIAETVVDIDLNLRFGGVRYTMNPRDLKNHIRPVQKNDKKICHELRVEFVAYLYTSANFSGSAKGKIGQFETPTLVNFSGIKKSIGERFVISTSTVLICIEK